MAASLSRAASAQHHSFFHSLGPTGNFDFALYIGADERLIAYVASLDLPFAPLTVTTANIDLRGSEAGFCLPVGSLGRRCPNKAGSASPEDGTNGGQQEEGGVLEALKELVAFRRRDMRWGRSGSEI
jgi:trehalose 6-phosphate synthase/phosphatase